MYIYMRFESQAGDLGLRSHAKESIPGLKFARFLFALSKMGMGPARGRMPQTNP